MRQAFNGTVTAILLLVNAIASGQEADVQHWALAPFLGTGAYDFDNATSIYVIEYTPRWTLQDAVDEGSVTQRAKIELLLPAGIGLANFDLADFSGTLDPGNVATLSFVPGVYATLPMSPRWTLLALANLGVGSRLDGEEAALIHRIGVRSRYSLGGGRQRLNLIAALEHIGYNTDSHRSDQLLPISLTAELELRVDSWASRAGPTHLVAHLTATHYLDDLSFDALAEVGATIENDFEIGLAVRPSDGFRLWKLHWERIGIAYRRGEGTTDMRDSEFEGLRLFFRSLFDQ
jgi:hypothetical protein